MRKFALAAPVIAALVSFVGHAQGTNAVLVDAARALGAANLNSIQYSGNGTNNAFGQGYAPGGPWPAFKVTSYTAAIDYTKPAMRVELERTNPDGVIRGGGGLPLLAPQRQIQIVSGTYAWNVAGQNATPAPAAVDDRLRAVWLSPHGVIKAAQQPTAKGAVSTRRGDDGKNASVITYTAAGLVVTATLTPDNLIARVETRSDEPV